MSEQQPNEPMSFSSFADWCRHIDSLSEGARHTVEVLLKRAGTDDAEAAERILLSMTELYLNYNQITDISSLGSLTNLTELYLSGNQITDISSLGSLTNLITLYLSGNQITDISSLGSLTNLTTLSLLCNQITNLSLLDSLTNSLTNLTKLDLQANWG
jgi:internalin A